MGPQQRPVVTRQDLDSLPAELPRAISSIRLLWSRWPDPTNSLAPQPNVPSAPRPSSQPSSSSKPQIYLRPPRRSDLQVVYDIHCDPRVHLHNPNGPDSWDRSRLRLAGWLHDWHQHGIGYMVVVQSGPFTDQRNATVGHRYTERVVGFTGLRFFHLPNAEVPEPSPILSDVHQAQSDTPYVRDGKEKVMNIYYRFSPLVNGKGVAYNAVMLALLYALRRFPDHQAAIMTPVANTPSRTLASRLGFTYLRDTNWAGIPHADFRFYDPERDRLFRHVELATQPQPSAFAAGPIPTLPILLRSMVPSDVEAQAHNMAHAFGPQLRPLFLPIPLDEPLSDQDHAEWIVHQRSRIQALLEEEKLAQGVRTVSVLRLDLVPPDTSTLSPTVAHPHIIGMITYEIPSLRVADDPVHASYSDLSRNEVAAKWKATRQNLMIDSMPSRASAARFAELKAEMQARRNAEMRKADGKEEAHYSLRLLCFRPDCRGQGVGARTLEWLMYSACGETGSGGDQGFYPCIPPVETDEDGTVLGAVSLSLPLSDDVHWPPTAGEVKEVLPWYLDATTVAVPFYLRHGYAPTRETEEKGPITFLVPEQRSYLEMKYAGTEEGRQRLDQLSMRLHPMVYRSDLS